jgi:hypothetical protein
MEKELMVSRIGVRRRHGRVDRRGQNRMKGWVTCNRRRARKLVGRRSSPKMDCCYCSRTEDSQIWNWYPKRELEVGSSL